MRATEASRGRWETAAAISTLAQVHWQAVKSIPLERMDGSPASADNSNGLLRTHRDRRTARHRAGTGGMDEQDAAKRTT